jgi:hypothetical protein
MCCWVFLALLAAGLNKFYGTWKPTTGFLDFLLHWVFGFLAAGYILYLHDKSLHARFNALEKRMDEIRKRLASDY